MRIECTARRALLSAALWAVGAMWCALAQELTLDSILAQFAQRQHGHVGYTEEVVSDLLERPLKTSGELFFDAPDRLEKRTLKPKAQQLIAEGDQLTLIRGRHRASMRLSDYPQLSPLLNGLRATLAGDRATLEKDFQVASPPADRTGRCCCSPWLPKPSLCTSASRSTATKATSSRSRWSAATASGPS